LFNKAFLYFRMLDLGCQIGLRGATGQPPANLIIVPV